MFCAIFNFQTRSRNQSFVGYKITKLSGIISSSVKNKPQDKAMRGGSWEHLKLSPAKNS